jgi:hypothetical protein
MNHTLKLVLPAFVFGANAAFTDTGKTPRGGCGTWKK